jgi:hypothetical protein
MVDVGDNGDADRIRESNTWYYGENILGLSRTQLATAVVMRGRRKKCIVCLRWLRQAKAIAKAKFRTHVRFLLPLAHYSTTSHYLCQPLSVNA